MYISASEARQRLFPLLEQVNTDHEPVRITSKAGDPVLISADDYDSWQGTVYLLRSPENARWLMEEVARDGAYRTAAITYRSRLFCDHTPMALLRQSDWGAPEGVGTFSYPISLRSSRFESIPERNSLKRNTNQAEQAVS